MKITLKKPGAGFYLCAVALALSLAALVLFIRVYGIFGYTFNRWVFFMNFAACWLLAFYAVNTVLAGDSPFWASYLLVAVPFLLLLAGLAFIQPCLSPIGIYFTVHNMGDVATMEAGVPPSIAAAALYVLASVLSAAAGFFSPVGREKKGNKEEQR